jgi:hypothetical protein
MAVRQGDWKLVRYDPVADGLPDVAKAVGPALYNLADDVGEERDLIAEHPDKAKELQAAWDKWNESNVPPKWGDGRGAGKKKARARRAAG